MSTHTHGPVPRGSLTRNARPRQRNAPDPDETRLAVRRLALLAAIALLVALLTSAFAGIVLAVAGLAVLAAHAAAHPRGS
jgi:hypothetical protein